MHRSLLFLSCLVACVAACAPHTPGCPKLKPMKQEKCRSAFGPVATCTAATITKNSASCSAAGAVLVVDTDDLFGGTDKMYCSKSTWRYNEIDPITGSAMDGPVPGGNMKVACVQLPPPGGK